MQLYENSIPGHLTREEFIEFVGNSWTQHRGNAVQSVARLMPRNLV